MMCGSLLLCNRTDCYWPHFKPAHRPPADHAVESLQTLVDRQISSEQTVKSLQQTVEQQEAKLQEAEVGWVSYLRAHARECVHVRG